METYKNIDEFIEKVFPMKGQEITKKSESKEFTEKADADFDEKLKAIIEGVKETEDQDLPDEKSQ